MKVASYKKVSEVVLAQNDILSREDVKALTKSIFEAMVYLMGEGYVIRVPNWGTLGWKTSKGKGHFSVEYGMVVRSQDTKKISFKPSPLMRKRFDTFHKNDFRAKYYEKDNKNTDFIPEEMKLERFRNRDRYER
jgi:nucleoid DNA-binding protein